MGLDMYLQRENTPDFELTQRADFLTNYDAWKAKYELAYWRKANQIHAWFVHTVQGDIDDCGDYPVSREHLAALYECVDMLLKEHLADPDNAIALAEIHLPTQPGFFFGGIDYDDYYWQDLEETRARLDAILADKTVAVAVYHASW